MEKQKRIDVLHFCAAQCTHCYDACHLEKEKDMSLCMINDQDCADICRLTAQVLERNSENAILFLKLSGQICERCATECDKHLELEHCKKCAEACHKCAEMCEQEQFVH